MALISYKAFLKDVQEKSKEYVTTNYECHLAETTSISNENGKFTEDLIECLERKDALAVWKCIANAQDGEMKKMEDLLVCRKIIENEKRNEENSGRGKIRYAWQNIKNLFQCQCPTKVERQQNASPPQNEQQDLGEGNEQRWLTILSDPLYVGLKWLWRTNPNNSSGNEDAEDVVKRALRDSYLNEELAKYEHHYSRDDYLKRALRCENFAAGVVEQSRSHELHQMMDNEGNGLLVCNDYNNNAACEDGNFSASLNLLRVAAENGRKKFVSSPKCQLIVNEIVYEDLCWQDKSIAVKAVWVLWQSILVVLLSALYIPYKLARLCVKRTCCGKLLTRNNDYCSCCRRCSSFCRILRKTFEHPYCKLVNHTTWYLAFLVLVFGSISERDIGTTSTGLSNNDYMMIAFVSGFIVVEIVDLYRQGCFVFFSKWWNVVDTLIALAFVLAYAMWLIAWGLNDQEWKPRSAAFVWADVFYASACVMAYFHLAHVFQVNRILGPLQLTLYKMLKDVLKFILIFLLLYIAFSTGLTKIYTYYVTAQIKLRNQNATHYDVTHPYERHVDTFLGLFWLLIGNLNPSDMDVNDPAFSTTQTFGIIYVIFYIIFMVIVALSMLIAMMNNSFERIMENSDMEWKFSRTQMWLEWIDKGNSLPSPLSNFLIPYAIFCGICDFCSEKKGRSEAYRQGVTNEAGTEESGESAASPEQLENVSSNTAEDSSEDYKKERIKTMRNLVVRYLVEYLEKDSKAEK